MFHQNCCFHQESRNISIKTIAQTILNTLALMRSAKISIRFLCMLTSKVHWSMEKAKFESKNNFSKQKKRIWSAIAFEFIVYWSRRKVKSAFVSTHWKPTVLIQNVFENWAQNCRTTQIPVDCSSQVVDLDLFHTHSTILWKLFSDLTNGKHLMKISCHVDFSVLLHLTQLPASEQDWTSSRIFSDFWLVYCRTLPSSISETFSCV